MPVWTQKPFTYDNVSPSDPVSPLILDLDGDGVETTSLASSNAMFDLLGSGFAIKTGWVGKDDGLLAIDANGNGTIDNIGELFGNKTTNGFSVLASRDSNGDGRISAADADYGRLLIWKDANSDGVSQPGEIRTLAEAGIQSISLSFQNVSLSNNGNPVTHRSTFTRTDGTTGGVDDVWFVNSPIISQQILPDTYAPSVSTLTRPVLASYGVLQDIVYRLDTDAAFAAKADAAIAAGRTGSIENYEQAFENLLWSWAGVANAGSLPNAGWADGEQFATLRALHGNTLYNNSSSATPGSYNGLYIAAEYSTALQSMAGKYLVQIAQGAEADGNTTPVLHAIAGLSFDRAHDVLVGDIDGAMTALGALSADPIYRDDAMRVARMIIQTIPPADAQRSTYIAHTLSASGLAGGDLAELRAMLESNAVIRLGDTTPEQRAYGANLFYGTSATQSIDGSVAKDVFVVSGGGDTLRGGDDNDTYIYRISDGNLKIAEDRSTTFGNGGLDQLLLPGGVTPADVTIGTGPTDKDVVLRTGSSTITLLSQLLGPNNVVEKVVFADGTVWDQARLLSAISTGTIGDDTLRGDWQTNTLNGGAGNDTISGNGGNDILIGGPGDDLLNGGEGQDVLRYSRGDGNDTVIVSSGYRNYGSNDTIAFGPDILPSDVTISQATGGADILVSISGGGSLLIKNGFVNEEDRLASITFADGTTWTSAQIMTKAMTGGDGNDVLIGTGAADTISGGAGDDVLDGGLGNDILVGGPGNDILRTGPGDDTVYYAMGDGQDTIINEMLSSAGGSYQSGSDKISFGPGILASDLAFTQSADGRDVVISLVGGGSITVSNALRTSTFTGSVVLPILGSLQFADGTTISGASVIAATMIGSGSGDIIHDSIFADDIRGGRGNDSIYISSGNDVVRYGLGDGQDIVYGGRYAKIQFDANIAPADVHFTYSRQNPYDIVANISGGGSIVYSQAPQTVAAIGGAVFSNGTTYTSAQITAMTAAPTTSDDVIWNTISGTATLDLLAGNDEAHVKSGSSIHGGDGDDVIYVVAGSYSASTLYGDAGNDLLVGGLGADSLYGGAGNDILRGDLANGYAKILDGGDGDDAVYARSIDKASGGAGTDTIDVSAQPGTWTFDLANTTSQAKVNNVSTSPWTGFENVIAGAGSDTILGDGGDNILRGMGGNDTIDGRGGRNLLDGGDGNDLLISRGLMDELIGGQGADVFRFASTTPGQEHTIDDFLTGIDHIDLSAFGLQVNAASGHDLSYLGTGAFSGQAGEIRYEGGDLMLDVNGDAQSDFLIHLGMMPPPLFSDFIL